MYGAPGNLDDLKAMVETMQRERLGNGFDPGPLASASSAKLFEYLATVGWPVVGYPPGYGEFQIKEGRARLANDDEAALQILDRAGVFNAIQLGEWGYYFHNLSSDRNWWKAVYGDDFAEFEQYLKPRGLHGYDTMPTSREECYAIVKDYFLTRNQAMRGRNLSVTGHSHYESYAAEWGARLIGLELGENIGFAQSKIAFARGAARQWNRPWSVQVSPWFHGSCTTSGPLRMIDDNYARGLDAGHSLSFYERIWLHSWFSGAAMVTPENSSAIFFEGGDTPWTLTDHGEKAADVFQFMCDHDRGVPYTPLAIVLDRYNGYNGYKGRPWGILEPTTGDLEIRDLFQTQLFPGSDIIHHRPNPDNPEAGYLTPTPYGELCDVLLSTATVDVLSQYPVILLAGDVNFDKQFINTLHEVLRRGSRLILHERHAKALGDELSRLQGTGDVEVLGEWVNPATGRSTAISNELLNALVDDYGPVTIQCDDVQYAINRTERGWVIELINNNGVTKFPTKAAVIDEEATAKVILTPKVKPRRISEWMSGQHYKTNVPINIELGPGASAFIELIEE